jgi:hypothetical protein
MTYPAFGSPRGLVSCCKINSRFNIATEVRLVGPGILPNSYGVMFFQRQLTTHPIISPALIERDKWVNVSACTLGGSQYSRVHSG